MFLIDIHCHLDKLFLNKYFKNIKDLIFFCRKKKIKYIVSVSVSINNFLYNFKKFHNINIVGLSCGIHPLYCLNVKKKNYLKLHKYSLYKEVIAIGETGLDFNIGIDNLFKKKQIYNFIQHLNISKKNNKPIIIHSRNAFFETLSVLRNFEIYKFGGVIHCYSYNDKYKLKKFLDIGCYISLSGLITFKSNFLLCKIIKYIPLDRLLVETDSPYLSPEPYRGEINNPSKILYIFKKISEIKNINILNIIDYNKKNFSFLFKIIF